MVYIPSWIFTPGTKARAGQVNANFAELDDYFLLLTGGTMVGDVIFTDGAATPTETIYLNHLLGKITQNLLVLRPLSATPGLEEGLVYYDANEHAPFYYNGTELKQFGTGAGATVLEGVPQSGCSNNDVVRFDGSDYVPALADTEEHSKAVGIIQNIVGAVGDVYLFGEVESFTPATPGLEFYLSDTVAGAVTDSKPDRVVKVGVGNTADSLLLDIDNQDAQGVATQSFASNVTWVFTHNLATKPNIQCYDDNDQIIDPVTIHHDSTNQATITFGIAKAGTARAVGGAAQVVSHYYEQVFGSSTTWTVNHNLGTRPVIVCLDESSATPFEIEPQSIEHLTLNSAKITFNPAQAGRAMAYGGSRQTIDLINTYEQGFNALTTWTVIHNLGTKPHITCFDSSATPLEIEPVTISHPTLNRCVITWGTAQTGTVIAVGGEKNGITDDSKVSKSGGDTITGSLAVTGQLTVSDGVVINTSNGTIGADITCTGAVATPALKISQESDAFAVRLFADSSANYVTSTSILRIETWNGAAYKTKFYVSGENNSNGTVYLQRNASSAETSGPVMSIVQDEIGDDQIALNIQQDGSGYVIRGKNAAAVYNSFFLNDYGGANTCYLSVCSPTHATGSLYVYRNLTSATTGGPVVLIKQDNTGDDQVALTIQQDCTQLALDIDQNGIPFDASVRILGPQGTGAYLVRDVTNAGNLGGSAFFYQNYDAASTSAVYIRQDHTTGAVPVLELDQDDISEGFINFVGSGRGVIAGATSSTESARVELNGTVYRIPLYADA